MTILTMLCMAAAVVAWIALVAIPILLWFLVSQLAAVSIAIWRLGDILSRLEDSPAGGIPFWLERISGALQNGGR